MDQERKESLRVEDQRCHDKAVANGEMTFTLRAQDASSPRVVGQWIAENIETAPEHKLRQALSIAVAMREHPLRRAAD